ncbi:MAG: NUDIX hydrolase [Clostridium sp.]|uniref:NUDIX hydrolase n=1 Tax=Clostridium sp. TaxID=1506 RepID=UPI003F2F3ED1
MNWIKEIEEYIPVNEQEQKDKENFLMCIENFDDVLTRKNVVCHITSSAFVLNKNRDKTLMIHHNIYNSWAWTGGHADGEENFLDVAIRELKEETGIKNVKPIMTDIAMLDVIPVKGHIKKGEFVSPHLHLSLAYLIEGDDKDSLTIKEDENSGVKWIPIKELEECVKNEPYMYLVYKKGLDRLK